MRVLMEVGLYHPVVGGEERHAERLARALRAEGHEIVIVTRRLAGSVVHELHRGIPVYRAIRAIELGPLFALSYMASFGAFLVRHRRRYDVIHTTYLYLGGITAILLRPLLRRPVVVRVVSGGPAGDLQWFRTLRFIPLVHWLNQPVVALALAVLRRADAFVVLSPSVADELAASAFPRQRIVCIPNGVDPKQFSPPTMEERVVARRALGIEAERVVLCVGRLARVKGQDVLLSALARLEAMRPPPLLVLVGGGPEQTNLEAQATALGIGQRVRFVGAVDDVRPYLRAADCFVLPSRSEGMPLALIEAMAIGLPCVATRVGGSRDLISPGETGLLVEPEDPGELAAALDILLREDRMAAHLGAAARTAVLDRFTLRTEVARYMAVTQRLVARQSSMSALGRKQTGELGSRGSEEIVATDSEKRHEARRSDR